MKFNYPQICSSLLKGLTERQKEIILLRFGLKRKGKKTTLESIGKIYGITRVRVRQIEKDALLKIRPEIKKNPEAFQYLKDYLKKEGRLKKENLLLEELGGKTNQNQIYFLLTLGEGFERVGETDDFHALWADSKNSLLRAEKTIATLSLRLKKMGHPLSLKAWADSNRILKSTLEASKKIQQNSEGLFGLREWPEINPRGVKDRAYLLFKKEQRPLHFREVAQLIGPALPQTVHNELIKDSRFVLVGRGLYALGEWGYQEGVVKEVILEVLQKAGKPLTKEEILKKVLSQRMVKENTVLLNLSNKEYFLRTPEGFYTINSKTA